MNRALTVVAITAAYLVLTGGALYLWLASAGHGPPPYLPLVCALPLALHLLATTSGRLSQRQRVVRSLGTFLFFPVLLVMWGAGSDFTRSEGASEEAAPGLRGAALFDGAIARQDLRGGAGTGFSTEGATFPDGSELRLLQFQTRAEAERYLKLLSDTFHAEDVSLGAHRGKRAKPGMNLLVYWELHGSSLLELRAGNELLARTRLEAQRVPVPSALPVAAAPAEPKARAVWPFALGFAVLHTLAFVLFVLWAGPATTGVARSTRDPAVSIDVLLARLASLPGLGVPLRLDAGESALERVLSLPTGDPLRAHRLTLQVDADQRLVRAIESEGAAGAAPRTADEARMADPIDARRALRPRAQKIWTKKRQITPLEPQRLAAIPLDFDADRARLPAGYAQTLDADGVLHLIALLVTRSGFDYQPVFFAAQRSALGSRARGRASTKP